MDEFHKELHHAFKEVQGSSAWSMDRNRRYDGQAHTHNGIRGSAIVSGLTVRDIADCMVRGFLAAGQIERENPIPDDVFQIDIEKLDPMATIQCTCCEIEKALGTYPNLDDRKEYGGPEGI